jgi:hypothetical protein
MSHVTFDEPLRYHQRLVRGEWSSKHSRRHHGEPVRAWWQVPEIGFLSNSTLRAMGWLNADQMPLPDGVPQPEDQAVRRELDEEPRHNPYLAVQPDGLGSRSSADVPEGEAPVPRPSAAVTSPDLDSAYAEAHDLNPASAEAPDLISASAEAADLISASAEVKQATPWWRQRLPAER